LVFLRAGVPVITRANLGQVDAAHHRLARVLGTLVRVVAVKRLTFADTFGTARIRARACILVVAGALQDHIRTLTGFDVTKVLGTHVSIVAYVNAAHAAWIVEQVVQTPECRVARVLGAVVPVVAVEGFAGLTLPVYTLVTPGAEVAIVTRQVNRLVDAAVRGADVQGARVVVPAVKGEVARYALTVDALVAERAWIAIVTRFEVEGIFTPLARDA